MPAAATAAPTTSAAAAAVRRLGRFELRRLVGRSARTMAWRVFDPRSAQELLLVLPRTQPATASALAAWIGRAQRAVRLSHPHLAHAVEVGEQERWPYIAYDGGSALTLAERAAPRGGDAALDIARWTAQAAAGLAFAHDAGAAHHDLQPCFLLLADNGSVRVMGLEAGAAEGDDAAGHASHDERRSTRNAAERDVLALAVLMHGLITGKPALDEPDVAAALARLAPEGREPIRLPWDLPRPVPEVLRTIANRATDRQPRQRYRNARTLARALEGFIESESQQGGDAHAQLIERVRQLGALPASAGAARRAARLALMEQQHNEELAQVVLRDAALTFELLRQVNSGVARAASQSGGGPVLTVRRAIAMVGLEGVRRVALALREWPGPLDAAGAADLERAIARAMRAARLAQALRPPGYDLEVVALIALMQNLGRLIVHYHAPEEMRQVARLMQPQRGAGEPDEPGLPERAAAFAVLGADIEAMGLAVARWWGMDEAVLAMVRRLPTDAAVRVPDNDDDTLRCLCSAANEAIDALALPPERQPAALERVAQRYARAMGLNLRDLVAALQASAGTDGAGGEVPTLTVAA